MSDRSDWVPIDWECRSCNFRLTTRNPEVAAAHHLCSGTGLHMPMIRVGNKERLILVERGDYIGKEKVTFDADGRPIMSAVTERQDGSNDATVYAPTAQFGVGS